MARVSEKHKRYRTKEQIVHDVAFVLAAPLSYGTKWAVLSDLTWVWTEFDGKYKGCPYWTEGAIMLRRVDPKAKLRHEHVVPKKVIIDMLMNLEKPSVDSVREICDRYLIGAIVMPEEDDVLNAEFGRSMPPEFVKPDHPGYHDPWLRYKKYSIKVVPAPN